MGPPPPKRPRHAAPEPPQPAAAAAAAPSFPDPGPGLLRDEGGIQGFMASLRRERGQTAASGSW